jgi:hypothetical protein
LPDPGAKPGRRGGKPATNRFSYGAAMWYLNTRSYLTRQEQEATSIKGANPSKPYKVDYKFQNCLDLQSFSALQTGNTHTRKEIK